MFLLSWFPARRLLASHLAACLCGKFRTCLFATDEFDLMSLLRNGATDDQLAAEIQRAVGTKWAGHQINQVNFIRPNRSMSQIGG